MDKKKLTMFAAIGGLATAIGCFLPWVTASFGPMSVSANGFDANTGTLTFILGLAAAIVAGLAWQGKSASIPLPAKTQMLIGAGCLALAAVLMLVKFFDDYGPASRGLGLYLSTLGAVGGAVVMFLLLKKGGMLPTSDAGGDD